MQHDDPDWSLARAFVHGNKRELGPDDHQSAEAYYAAMGGFRHDLALLGGYLARLFRG